VLLGGQAMPLLYASATQVNALVPQAFAPNASYPPVMVRVTTQSAPVPSGRHAATAGVTARLTGADWRRGLSVPTVRAGALRYLGQPAIVTPALMRPCPIPGSEDYGFCLACHKEDTQTVVQVPHPEKQDRDEYFYECACGNRTPTGTWRKDGTEVII
jgi:hypothetical protein